MIFKLFCGIYFQVLQWDQSFVALNLLLYVTQKCGLYQLVSAKCIDTYAYIYQNGFMLSSIH